MINSIENYGSSVHQDHVMHGPYLPLTQKQVIEQIEFTNLFSTGERWDEYTNVQTRHQLNSHLYAWTNAYVEGKVSKRSYGVILGELTCRRNEVEVAEKITRLKGTGHIYAELSHVPAYF